jgi:hypothetical protein
MRSGLTKLELRGVISLAFKDEASMGFLQIYRSIFGAAVAVLDQRGWLLRSAVLC